MSGKSLMELLKTEHKKDTRETIIEYLVSEPGTLELTHEQQDLLDKWQFVDDQIRTRRYTTSEVAKIVMRKYNKSIAQAWRYINDARFVFGSSMKTSKRYLLAVHAEGIELQLQMAAKEGDRKSYAALSREYTAAIKEMPEDSKGRTAAPMTVYLIAGSNINSLMDVPIVEAEAREIAKKKIGTDIDFIEE